MDSSTNELVVRIIFWGTVIPAVIAGVALGAAAVLFLHQ